MKVINKPIEVIALFRDAGIMSPLKFRLALEGESPVFKVDKIITRTMEKLAGNRMIVFLCQSDINGALKRYEIKYELDTMKWFLFKT
jgi:hypothetical protein